MKWRSILPRKKWKFLPTKYEAFRIVSRRYIDATRNSASTFSYTHKKEIRCECVCVPRWSFSSRPKGTAWTSTSSRHNVTQQLSRGDANQMTFTLRLPRTMNPSNSESLSVVIDVPDISVGTEKVANDTFRTLESESTAGDVSEAFSVSSSSSLSDDEQENIKICVEPRVLDENQGEKNNVKIFEPLVSSQLRKSILKISAEEIPICSRRSSWKTLPQPDMESIRNISVGVKVGERPVRRKSGVEFSQIRIREYEQTLGDNPSVSFGPPITLDWKFEEREPVSLEQYEAQRPPRRSIRHLCLSYYTRRNLLMWIYDLEEAALKKATKDVDRIKRERAFTRYLLPCSKVEDFVTSAGRKAKRVVQGKAWTFYYFWLPVLLAAAHFHSIILLFQEILINPSKTLFALTLLYRGY